MKCSDKEWQHCNKEKLGCEGCAYSDEISIGDYVRTNNGIIGKYAKYRGWQDTIETNNKWIGFDIDKDIVKHSKNIINLIQERRLCKWL